jgi:hypothetical protein
MKNKKYSIVPTSNSLEGGRKEDGNAEKGGNPDNDNKFGETFVDNSVLYEIVQIPSGVIKEQKVDYSS